MVSSLRNRIKTSLSRDDRNESPKLIVISGEGPVTEEIYFDDILTSLCASIKDKIRIVSAREEFFELEPALRTQTDLDEQNKSQPRQVLERMDNYLHSKKYIQQSHVVDDEYWLVLDVDNHTDEYHIDEWNSVLAECENKNYKYAVSNPFFEVWLLLHYRDANDKDKSFEVTPEKPYRKTNHFATELKSVGAPLKGQGKKEPQAEHYSLDKIKDAIMRAEILHNKNKDFKELPQSFGSTVYILVENIIALMA